MAIGGGLAKQGLPFINQSIARSLRGGAFRTKNQFGPQTTQAITEGTLETDSRRAAAAAQNDAQIASQQKMHAESLAAQRYGAETQMAEDTRQFDIRAQLDRQQHADRMAANHDANREKEQSFFDGVFGS